MGNKSLCAAVKVCFFSNYAKKVGNTKARN